MIYLRNVSKLMTKNQLFDMVAQYCCGLKTKAIVAMFSFLLQGNCPLKLWLEKNKSG